MSGVKLTDDAKFLGYTLFGLMEVGRGVVTFKMIESKPSPRTQAALDELVAAGMISAEPLNRFGGISYKPLVEFRRVKAPAGKWSVTVPLAEANHD